MTSAECQEAGGERAVDAGQTDLPATHQRVGNAGPGDAAGGLDHGRDHQEGSHAEDQAQRGQDAGAEPHRRADLVRFGCRGAPGLPEQADAGGLDDGQGGQPPGEGEGADADRHGYGDGGIGGGQPVQHGLEQEPFAHEAAEHRHGGHGQAADQERSCPSSACAGGDPPSGRGPWCRSPAGASWPTRRAIP